MAYRQTITKTIYKNGVAYHAQRKETYAEARQRHRKDRYLNFKMRESQKSMVRSSGANFFTIVFMCLFLIMFFSAATGLDTSFTFTGFLEGLADSPSIDTSWIKTFNSLRITSDWDIFNFLRDFINTFMDIISVLLWLVTGIAQLVVYVGYLFRVFFSGGA